MYKLISQDKSQIESNNYLLEDSDINLNDEAETTNSTPQGEELNKGLMVKNSSPLTNVFKSNSMKKINIFIDVIFIGTFFFLLAEFLTKTDLHDITNHPLLILLSSCAPQSFFL